MSANVSGRRCAYAVDNVRFEHLVMLDFDTVPRVCTRLIAVDRRRSRATAVDDRNARVTAAVRTLLNTDQVNLA